MRLQAGSGRTLTLCDGCWFRISAKVWIIPGPVAAFGSCTRCGGWFSVRDLAEIKPGGKQAAPAGICPACAE